MASIRVVVYGSSKRLRQAIVNSLCREPEIQLARALRRQVPEEYLPLPNGSGTIPLSSNVEYILTSYTLEVLVDTSTNQVSMPAVCIVAERGIA